MNNTFNELTYDELMKRRDEMNKRYLDLRMNKVLSHVDNPLEIRILRRNIARANTILHEFALGIRKQ